eukprot:TRINITY_DN10132_c0_g2_i1.p1 TRINITY_DN10132_c0_g2~~TRINITY_DN10132_c0_g2_i1.p1  ORF type:complete len:102 (+),score=9.41 TRINITY_DN10132_c0_g2_i1:2-307(+)
MIVNLFAIGCIFQAGMVVKFPTHLQGRIDQFCGWFMWMLWVYLHCRILIKTRKRISLLKNGRWVHRMWGWSDEASNVAMGGGFNVIARWLIPEPILRVFSK